MDEVGIDPDRLAQAASALEELRDTLAANVPVIVNTLNGYWSDGVGSPVNLSALQQAMHRSVDDAAQTRARSDLAQRWLAQADACLPGSKTVIPWDPTPAQEAHADADLLAQAEADSGTNPKAARAQIEEIEADIRDHLEQGQDGTSWLAAFYNQSSPQVASLASTLNAGDGGDGVVLTEDDKRILRTFALGLAHVDKTGSLNQTAIDAYAGKAKNLWSVGMLFKFGPRGSAYGTQEMVKKNAQGEPILDSYGNPEVQPNLIAQATTAIEMARLKPGGYVIPLAGAPTGLASMIETLQEFDPSQSILTLASENGAAAREVIAGADGEKIAAGLMDQPTTFFPPLTDDDQIRGYFTEPPPDQYLHGIPVDYTEPIYMSASPLTISPTAIGNFFNVATEARRGADAASYDSAVAAMHLMQATPPLGKCTLAAPVHQALLNTAERYIFDLAKSCNNYSDIPGQPAASEVLRLDAKNQGPFVVLIGAGPDSVLATFLQQVTSRPVSAGIMMASARTALGQYYGLMAAGKSPAGLGSDPTYMMAQLIGQIQTQATNAGIKDAAATDALHAEYNSLLTLGESLATKAPAIGAPIGAAQTAASLLGINMPHFDTENTVDLESSDAQRFGSDQLKINVPMTQGLINAGAIPADALQDQLWFRDGHIVLTSPTIATQFNNWFTSSSNPAYNQGLINDMSSYQEAMMVQSTANSINPEYVGS